VVATSGMATVFARAISTPASRSRSRFPHPEVESDPALFDRFQREEDIGTRMDHPGVMKVFEPRPAPRSTW
jgi:hypothetical protein